MTPNPFGVTMRRATLLLTLFALGALTMDTIAQEKVDPKKDDGPKAPFTQRVTVKRYAGQKDLEFLDPHKDVDGRWYEGKKDKKDYFQIKGTGKNCSPGGNIPLKSEITDKDGTVWVVTRQVGPLFEASYHVEVKKKEDAKKP